MVKSSGEIVENVLLNYLENDTMRNLILILALSFPGVSYSTTYIVGDSIAHGYKQKVGGKGRTKIGASPATVLTYVKNTPKNTSVILSTGISNNPKDFKSVEKQFTHLKGHKKVLVMGVSNTYNKFGVKGYSINSKLSILSRKYGYSFTGGFKASKDNVHPLNYNFVKARG